MQGIEDMITLPNMTEENMLKNLQIRYSKDLIYVSNLRHSFHVQKISNYNAMFSSSLFTLICAIISIQGANC